MNYVKTSLCVIVVLALFLMVQAPVEAAAFPLAGVNILAKSISTGRVVSTMTDSSGNFSAGVLEESGIYNIFVDNEELPPVKITAKSSVVSGRVVILTDGTTTKDPVPTPIATPVKKVTPVTPPKTVKPVTKVVTPLVLKPIPPVKK